MSEPLTILTSDVALNDLDKTLTVPDGKVWQFQSLRMEYTASATAGSRLHLITRQFG